MEKSMNELEKGQRGRVLRFEMEAGREARLRDIGLNPGEKIVCRIKSPLGGIAAYEILGSIMALRDSEAAKIIVETEEN